MSVLYTTVDKTIVLVVGKCPRGIVITQACKARMPALWEGKYRDSWHLLVILLHYLNAGIFPLAMCLALPPGA